MSQVELLKFFAQAGIGGLLAGLMFWFYRIDSKEHAATVKAITDTHAARMEQVTTAHADELRELLANAREDRKQLVGVIIENTKSNQQLITVTDALHRRLDNIRMGRT